MEWLTQHLHDLPQDLHSLLGASFSIGGININPFLIIKSLLIVGVLLWICGIIVRATDRRLRRVSEMRTSTRTLILKILQIILYFFIFVFGLQLLGINLGALGVFGGALGVGIGFGLQKVASNFISGIILLFEKSIESGDLIELTDGTLGTVKRTYARYTLLELPDGREILIPNEEFIIQRVVSFTHSDKDARIVITVKVTYDSDIELVQKLMLDAADAHPARIKKRESQCHVDTFSDFGVQLKLFFWVADVTEGRSGPRSDVMKTILAAFKANNITIAQPKLHWQEEPEAPIIPPALSRPAPKP